MGWRCRRSSCCRRQLSAQTAKFEDVVRNLRNPDQKIRNSGPGAAAAGRYAEAIVPMAPRRQRSDRRDPARSDRHLRARLPDRAGAGGEEQAAGFVVEAHRRLGWRRHSTPPARGVAEERLRELVDALLTAVDDDRKKVRLEAIYTLAVVAGASVGVLPEPARGSSRRRSLHRDPRGCRPRHRPADGEIGADGLLKAVNDSSAPSTLRRCAR